MSVLRLEEEHWVLNAILRQINIWPITWLGSADSLTLLILFIYGLFGTREYLRRKRDHFRNDGENQNLHKGTRSNLVF